MSTDAARSYLTQAQGLLANALTELPSPVPDAPPPPPTYIVKAGDNLQAVIDKAVPGSTIRIAPSLFAPITLRAVLGAPITLRPDVDDSLLPAVGVRASAAFIPNMFSIVPSGNVGVSCDLAAGPYTIIGMHVSSPTINGTMVAIGDLPFVTLADCPHDITLDRCYLDGGNACKRGASWHGTNLNIINSVITGVVKVGQDTQAIGIARGPGPYLIENNYLSAGSETILVGGDDPTIQGLIPSDITIRRNYVTKDPTWQAVRGQVKNAFELKNAQRVLVEYNTFEYAWVDEQTGFLVQITVRNQNGKAPWSTVRDVEIRYNHIRHGFQALNILGLDDIKDATGVVHPSVRAQNINIHHNLFEDVGAPNWGKSLTAPGTSVAIAINNGPVNVTLDHNTFIGASVTTPTAGLAISLGTSKTQAVGLKVTRNILTEGSYGITGDGTTVGLPSWTAGVDATSTMTDNLIVPGGIRKLTYPAGNTVAATTFTGGIPSVAYMCADHTPAGADIATIIANVPTQ